MFYVYILYSQKTDKYYVGQTADLNARLLRHNSNMVPATKGKGLWTMVYKCACNTRGEAMKVEKEIKLKKSRHYIETLIAKFNSENKLS